MQYSSTETAHRPFVKIIFTMFQKPFSVDEWNVAQHLSLFMGSLRSAHGRATLRLTFSTYSDCQCQSDIFAQTDTPCDVATVSFQWAGSPA